MKKKSKFIGYIIGIVLFISTIAGFTYAMYRKSLYNVNISGELKNLNEYVIYSKGVNISSGTLNPVDSYTEGSSATITFYKRESPYDIYGHIYLDINTMSAGTSHELKYTIVDNSTSNIVGEGSFYTYTTGSSLLAAANIPLNTTETTYTVYVWVDESLYDINTGSSGIDIDIRCYATMKTIYYASATVPSIDTAANYIKYMYDRSPKSAATVNNITYNLASDVSLMNDRHASMSTGADAGDIRYYGANPNNYVWLGDNYTSSYTFMRNGSRVTRNVGDKKLWRIIGVFDGRLKLISNDQFSLSWDTSASTVNSGLGINQWGPSGSYEGADLMKLLNPGYEENEDLDYNGNTVKVNNSLYWNKESGTVYFAGSNGTTNESFTATGLSGSEKNMIDSVTWYLGSYENLSYVDKHYNAERGTLHVLNPNDGITRTDTWYGKVGLIYPSDYGYAADLSQCNQKLGGYNNCRTNNWLKDTSGSLSTISARFYSNKVAKSYSVFGVSRGNLSDGSAAGGTHRPAIYLKSSVIIIDGIGTETDPYVLSLE